MKYEDNFSFVFFMKAILLASVSAGLYFGLSCFSSVDIGCIYSSAFAELMLVTVGLQFLFFVSLCCFSKPVSIFIKYLFIFLKSFSFAFLLKLFADSGLLCREFILTLSLDILVLSFASVNLNNSIGSAL